MQKIMCGLEIHTYIKVDNNTKLFCECKLSDAEPNTNICPICTAQPGSKPMLPNKEAVEKTLKIALMLQCQINNILLFQRKHYSWPDLPSGYQRTISGSYALPLGQDGEFLDIGISDVHLEEDPARWDPETGTIDYNRSGTPLVEIVTKPDFQSVEQVRDWLRYLIVALTYIDSIDPEIGVKADVNVSIAPNFQRVEIKNINSFKAIGETIAYEITRQASDLNEGKLIRQETRAWDDIKKKTVFMRLKETTQDYMFIPDPDLPKIEITSAYIENLKKQLPERPDKKIERYVKKWNLDKIDARVIGSDISIAEFFEEIAKKVNPIRAAQFFRRDLMRVLNYNNLELKDTKLKPEHIIVLLENLEEKKITEEISKRILEKLVIESFNVKDYIKEHKLEAVSDKKIIEQFCEEAIKENPEVVKDYLEGSEKALNFIVGQVMRKSKGKAEPKIVNEIIKKLIKKEK